MSFFYEGMYIWTLSWLCFALFIHCTIYMYVLLKSTSTYEFAYMVNLVTLIALFLLPSYLGHSHSSDEDYGG